MGLFLKFSSFRIFYWLKIWFSFFQFFFFEFIFFLDSGEWYFRLACLLQLPAGGKVGGEQGEAVGLKRTWNQPCTHCQSLPS